MFSPQPYTDKNSVTNLQFFNRYSLKMFHNRCSEKIELVCACYYQFRQKNCTSRYLDMIPLKDDKLSY